MRRFNVIMSAMLIGSMLGGPALAAERKNAYEKQQKIQQQKEIRREAARETPRQKPENGPTLNIHPGGGKKGESSSSWLSGGGGGHRDGPWSF